MPKVYIGMSGWKFEGWRKDFYPQGLVQSKELEYASRKVNSIEINGTFYALQKPHTFEKWYDETPKDFCFAIKAPQYITHIRRLKDVKEPLSNFLASGLFCLKEKQGPILWQFPPNVTLKDDRFEKFLEILPYDSKAASKLAKKHSSKMDNRSFTKVSGDYPIRHAFEFRHKSFMDEKFMDLLRKHGVAIVFAHSGVEGVYTEDLTADFIYARMHGQEKEFKKGYHDKFLDHFAERVDCWTNGRETLDPKCVSPKNKHKKRDAFIYFDTEAKAFAPYDAMNLMERLR